VPIGISRVEYDMPILHGKGLVGPQDPAHSLGNSTKVHGGVGVVIGHKDDIARVLDTLQHRLWAINSVPFLIGGCSSLVTPCAVAPQTWQ
jgi:hypothetical protein